MDFSALEQFSAGVETANNEANERTLKIAEYLYKKYESKEKFEFNKPKLKECFYEYIHAIIELNKTCGKYGKPTTLQADLNRIQTEAESDDTNDGKSYRSDENSVENLQKVIAAIGISSQNVEIAIRVLEIMNNFNMFWDGLEMENIVDEMLKQIPANKETMVMEYQNLHLCACFASFMCKILIENQDKHARIRALEILRSNNCISEENRQIMILEEKCNERYPDILQQCYNHVNVKRPLPFSCFEIMTEYFTANETKCIIENIIGLKIQKIPNHFIREFKKFAAVHQPGILEIGKLLIKGQYILIGDIGCINQWIESDKMICDALDLINTAMISGNKIPGDIIQKLENKAVSSTRAEKVLNILRTLYGIETAADIVKNPKKSFLQRKKALEEIKTCCDVNHNAKVLKILEVVIRLEENLRYNAFKALISILVCNCLNGPFTVNFESVLKYMSGTPIDVSDVISLIPRDKELDLLNAILKFFTNTINLPISHLFMLLDELSSSEQGRKIVVESVQPLLGMSRHIEDPTLRDKMSQIVVRICQSVDSDFTINLCYAHAVIFDVFHIYTVPPTLEILNTKYLLRLQHVAEAGYPVPQAVVDFLISSLKNSNLQVTRDDIGKILSLVNLSQGLRNQVASLFDALINNPQLFEVSCLILIIEISVATENLIDTQTWAKFLSILSTEIDNDPSALTLNLLKVANLVPKATEFPIDVLERISTILNNKLEKIELRISIANLLSKQIMHIGDGSKIPKTVKDRLQAVAMEINAENCKKIALLKKCAFQSLDMCVEENKIRKICIEYYGGLKNSLIQMKAAELEDLKILDDYISSESAVPPKFRLLKTLSYIISKRIEFHGRLFTASQEGHWERILLTRILTTSTYKCSSSHDLNEVTKERFSANLMQLCAKRGDQSELKHSIEDILQALIQKQNLFSLDINIVNDILEMLASFAVEDVLFNNSKTCLSDMKDAWLVENLKTREIEYSSKSIKELRKLCKYQIKILLLVFRKVKKNTAIVELLNFFKMLNSCELTEEERELFLAIDIVGKKSISDWKFQLDKKVIDKLLNKQFPDFDPTPPVNQYDART